MSLTGWPKSSWSLGQGLALIQQVGWGADFFCFHSSFSNMWCSSGILLPLLPLPIEAMRRSDLELRTPISWPTNVVEMAVSIAAVSDSDFCCLPPFWHHLLLLLLCPQDPQSVHLKHAWA